MWSCVPHRRAMSVAALGALAIFPLQAEGTETAAEAEANAGQRHDGEQHAHDATERYRAALRPSDVLVHGRHSLGSGRRQPLRFAAGDEAGYGGVAQRPLCEKSQGATAWFREA